MSMKEHRESATSGMRAKLARMGGKMGDKKHLERGGKCYATGGAVGPAAMDDMPSGMPAKPSVSKPGKHKGKGKSKGKGDTHVNVVVMPKGGDAPMPPPGPPPGAMMPPPMPPKPPMMPPGGPPGPMGGPPGMPPGPPMGGPPMMHASGGRVGRKHGGKVKKADGGAIDTPMASALDKYENSRKNVAPSMGRAVGGPVKGTKDGAGGGKGRMEKMKMYGDKAGKVTVYSK